jgi:hypothetical protein
MKNLPKASDLILWEWNLIESYKNGMWYPIWAFVFGWKVTKTRDAIRIAMEVQINSKAEIQKAQTIQR